VHLLLWHALWMSTKKIKCTESFLLSFTSFFPYKFGVKFCVTSQVTCLTISLPSLPLANLGEQTTDYISESLKQITFVTKIGIPRDLAISSKC
jgi:hypothetical protein